MRALASSPAGNEIELSLNLLPNLCVHVENALDRPSSFAEKRRAMLQL